MSMVFLLIASHTGAFLSQDHLLIRCSALWNTYPPHDNYGQLPNVHKQAVLDIAFSLDSEVIYSVSLCIPYPRLPSIHLITQTNANLTM